MADEWKSVRVTRADDAYAQWPGVRSHAWIRGDGIEVFREGIGGYTVSFDFAATDAVEVVARDPLGPSADPERLHTSVDAANAALGGEVFEVSGPFVLIRRSLPRGPEGITLGDLEAARVDLVGLLDERHAEFAAPGRAPFHVHIDHEGRATLTPVGRGTGEDKS